MYGVLECYSLNISTPATDNILWVLLVLVHTSKYTLQISKYKLKTHSFKFIFYGLVYYTGYGFLIALNKLVNSHPLPDTNVLFWICDPKHLVCGECE